MPLYREASPSQKVFFSFSSALWWFFVLPVDDRPMDEREKEIKINRDRNRETETEGEIQRERERERDRERARLS